LEVYEQETHPVLNYYPPEKIVRIDATMSQIRVLSEIIRLLVPLKEDMDRAWEKSEAAAAMKDPAEQGRAGDGGGGHFGRVVSRARAAPSHYTVSRYHRQILLPQVGPAGQQRLGQSTALLIGCGALGAVIAEQLVRGGLGTLRICDRDVVETTNLQRQVLFDEADASAGVPKAIAAAQRLKRINSTVRIEPHVVDVHSGNIEQLVGGADVLLDGTDNADVRY
jgi:hypothetical protein